MKNQRVCIQCEFARFLYRAVKFDGLIVGIQSASLATSSDEVNLLCGMTAHGLNPRIHTIARIRNPEYGKQIFTMRDVYSLSLMVNPEKQAARED